MAKVMLQVLCDDFEASEDVYLLAGELVVFARPFQAEIGVKTMPLRDGDVSYYRGFINIVAYTEKIQELTDAYKETLSQWFLGDNGGWNVTAVIDYFNGFEEQRGPISIMDFLLESERKDSVPF